MAFFDEMKTFMYAEYAEISVVFVLYVYEGIYSWINFAIERISSSSGERTKYP